ncbi:hypothetical protein [Erysipelothrix aquatica]|uniref:hypothetical protein n=1 Tax=Erysipelothrix aquatica TaxID=2683714 RepID=UPI0039F010CD
MYLNIQRADDIVVILPAEAGEKIVKWRKKSNLSIHVLQQKSTKLEIEDSQTTSCTQMT